MIRKVRNILHLITKTNLIKTIYFNFKMFPPKTALKFPFVIYHQVKLSSLSGKLILNFTPNFKSITFGLNTDGFGNSSGKALIKISGTLIFNGPVIFSVDNTLEVIKNATLEIGSLSAFGNSVKIRCWDKMLIGQSCRLASEVQVFDTNFHHIKDISTGEVKKSSTPIKIGAYNWIGNRSTIMKGTITPDWCIVTSNSLLNKEYTTIPENSIIGGMPAKFIKTGVYRVFNFKEDNEIFEYFVKNPEAKNYFASKEKKELTCSNSEIFPLFG